MLFGRMTGGRAIFTKVISIFITQTFIASSIAFAAPMDIADNAKDPSSKQEVVTDPEKIVIPKDTGILKSKYKGSPDRLVIHIQDAHCNYEAQTNIAKMIEGFVKNDGLKLVSVEGADGIVDTSWFKAFPDEEIRKEVATYFMKKGEITGPEFLSITTDYPIKLFGAETREYYIQNLNAFTSSYPLKAETEKYYTQVKSVLNRLKGYIYNEGLKALDSKMEDYESKKIQFNDYIRYLQDACEKYKINPRAYDNFFKLVSVLIYEKKINFNVVDKERSAVIDVLTKKMSKDQITKLVTQSLAFKVGKISSVEFYAYLKALAQQNEVDLAKDYPNLFNYIIYNSVYSRIENEKLFHEIKLVETAIKEKLFQNDDQRMLEKLSRHVDTIIGLINIKLLNGDYDYYKTHKSEFAPEVFADFIKNKSIQYGFNYDLEAPTEAVTKSIPKLEDFYAIAIKRDRALVDNTLAAMAKENAKISVLVTGGFHSEGISKLLEKEGVSYIVICPNITKNEPNPYIQILTNQRTSFEDLLTDTGAAKAEMLAPIILSQLVPMNPDRIRAAFANIRGVDGSSIDAMIDAIIQRTLDVKTAYAMESVRRWMEKVLHMAANDNLIRDQETVKEAYRIGMTNALSAMKEVENGGAALSFGEKLAIRAKVDEIWKAAQLDQDFDRIYVSISRAREGIEPQDEPGDDGVGAIRKNGIEGVTARDHGLRYSRLGKASMAANIKSTLNGAIGERIDVGMAYSILETAWKATILGEININPATDEDIARLGDASRVYAQFKELNNVFGSLRYKFVVVRGLKERLPEGLKDVIFHYGVTRNQVYIDEGDLAKILSLYNGVELLIQAFKHEIAHIENPDASEAEVEAMAPTKKLRLALLALENNLDKISVSEMADTKDLFADNETARQLRALPEKYGIRTLADLLMAMAVAITDQNPIAENFANNPQQKDKRYPYIFISSRVDLIRGIAQLLPEDQTRQAIARALLATSASYVIPTEALPYLAYGRTPAGNDAMAVLYEGIDLGKFPNADNLFKNMNRFYILGENEVLNIATKGPVANKLMEIFAYLAPEYVNLNDIAPGVHKSVFEEAILAAYNRLISLGLARNSQEPEDVIASLLEKEYKTLGEAIEKELALRSEAVDTGAIRTGRRSEPAKPKGNVRLTEREARAALPFKADEADALFWPDLNFVQGKPIDASLIQDRIAPGAAERALAVLRQAQADGRELSIEGHLRGVDGPGSSLDLPEFQVALTPDGALELTQIPSTPTIASEFKVKIRFEVAADPEAIEYIGKDFRYSDHYKMTLGKDGKWTLQDERFDGYQGQPIDEAHPYSETGLIQLENGMTPYGQLDAPAFIFRNLFGLKGVRIICEEAPAMALAGGMESSNVFNVALIAAASMLSGANLSQADIFNLAVKLENDELKGLTGGQGHLCTMVGGAYRHVWLSGMKDAQGNLINPYSALSIPLLKEDQLKSIEDHSMLVQAGKDYKNAIPQVKRTAALINWMWTDLLRDRDEVGVRLHTEKLGLAARYTEALQKGDFQTAMEMINRYVDIRNELCLRWTNLMLDARAGLPVPEYAKVYAAKTFDVNHPLYEEYKVMRDSYDEYGENIRNISLYSLEPIASLIAAARAADIAIMPLGAGGPGANLIAVSPKGADHIRKFLTTQIPQPMQELTNEVAADIVHGTGTLRGFMPFKVGREPMKFTGFGEMGLPVPTPTGTTAGPAAKKKPASRTPKSPTPDEYAKAAAVDVSSNKGFAQVPKPQQDLPDTPPMAPVAGQMGMPDSVLQARAVRGAVVPEPGSESQVPEELEEASRLMAIASSYDFSKAPREGVNMSPKDRLTYVETTPYALLETLSQIRMTPGEAEKGVVIVASDTGMTRAGEGQKPEVNTRDVFKAAADLTGGMLGEIPEDVLRDPKKAIPGDKLVINIRGSGAELLNEINRAISQLQNRTQPIAVRSVVVIAGNHTMNTVGAQLADIPNSRILNVQDTEQKLVPAAALYELAVAIGFDMGEDKLLRCFNRIGRVLDASGDPIDLMDSETLRRILSEKLIRILPVIGPVNTADHVAAQAAARKALVSL